MRWVAGRKGRQRKISNVRTSRSVSPRQDRRRSCRAAVIPPDADSSARYGGGSCTLPDESGNLGLAVPSFVCRRWRTCVTHWRVQHYVKLHQYDNVAAYDWALGKVLRVVSHLELP